MLYTFRAAGRADGLAGDLTHLILGLWPKTGRDGDRKCRHGSEMNKAGICRSANQEDIRTV